MREVVTQIKVQKFQVSEIIFRLNLAETKFARSLAPEWLD